MCCKVIIDGNSMLSLVISSTLYSTTDTDLARPFFCELDKYTIKSTAEQFYKECVFNYVYGFLRSVNYVDEVFFCFDDASWRKVYYNKYVDTLKGRHDYNQMLDGYKGTRDKKDDDKRIQLKELVKYLSKNVIKHLCEYNSGFHYVSMKGLEGDDLVSHLVNKFKKDNQVFVWSNDGDMLQILDKNVCIIGSLDKKTNKKKLFTIEDKFLPKETENMFDFINYNPTYLPSSFDSIVKNMTTNGTYFETKINPVYEIFTKILIGDKKSDNIYPCFSMTKAGKVVNVTKAKVSDIIYNSLLEQYTENDIMSHIDNVDDDFLNLISDKICDIFMCNPNEYSELIKNGLKFNIKLVRLSETIIPKSLCDYVDANMIDNRTVSQFNMQKFLDYIKK